MDIQAVLSGTLSSDGPTRQQAESSFSAILAEMPDMAATGLLEAARTAPTQELREVACVLFRRFTKHITDESREFWPRVNEQTRQAVKQGLLEAVAEEQPAKVRHKICDCLAGVAKELALEYATSLEEDDEEDLRVGAEQFWPELLQVMFQLAQSAVPAHRESTLLIFSTLPGVLGNSMDTYFPSILGMVAQSLQDDDWDVMVAATKAFSSLILVVKKEQRFEFGALLPAFLDVIVKCLVAGNTDGGQQALESLIDVAEITPKIMRECIPIITERMVEIASNQEIAEECRRLALEVTVALAESAAGMVRKYPDFAAKVVPVCLQLMLEIEEDDEWTTYDEIEDMSEEDNVSAGETSLDRLACALGGAAVLPVAFGLVPTMLAAAEWQNRHAGCIAISALGEGCGKFMKPYLHQIVERVVPMLQDPYPRVRYAAANAVGQMAVDFAPEDDKEVPVCFQAQFHSVCIPGLLEVMGMEGHPRVQAHAAAAFINFIEHCEKSTLEPYLESVLTRVIELLQSSSLIVQEQAITTLATVADTAETLFRTYYASFMPHLKLIMQSAAGREHRLLRSKTFECVTLMGMAVGKEMFEQDAMEIMMALKGTEDAGIEADDPQVTYMLSCWARICQILGEDFAPFVEAVIPPLLRSAQIEPTLKPIEHGENIENLPDGLDAWEIIAIDGQRIGIKTSMLEEKRCACEMLAIYARELRHHFAPYVEHITPFMTKYITFVLEDGVRVAAATIQPYLLICLCESQEPYGPGAALMLWNTIYPILLSQIKQEMELDVLSHQLCALKTCLPVMEESIFTPVFLEDLTLMLEEVLSDFEERTKMRMEQRTQDEDYDPEAEVILSEEEELENEVTREVSEIIHYAFGYAKTHFLPYFDRLLKYFVYMLQPGRHYADIQWALCVFDDLLEYCGEASYHYAGQFVERLLQCITDHHYQVRQAAAYGVGMMSLHGGPGYADACKAAVPQLLAVINSPDSRVAPSTDATENCMSAFVKIVQMEHNGFNLEEVLPTIISFLPLTEDAEEAEYVYGFLCDLIEAQNPLMMMDDRLFQFADAVSQVIGTDVISEDSPVTDRCVAIIKHACGNVEGFEGRLMTALDVNPEVKEVLTRLLTGHSA